MSENRTRIQIIIASTRPGRAGLPVAQWVVQEAAQREDYDFEVVDLAEVDLPPLLEPHHPRLQNYTQAHTRAFSKTISRADGFIIVLPEYNHGYNAELKNALDHLALEWAGKPVALVSYGGIAGGARATHALKPVLAALRMLLVPEGVLIPMVNTYLQGKGEERAFVPSPQIAAGLAETLDGLQRWIRLTRA